MGKEKFEKKCIEDILSFSPGRATERYVKQFRKYAIVDDWNEAPDFLLVNQGDYCGIEHFVIDVFNDEIDGHVRSGSRLVCENIDGTYNKYHEKLLQDTFDSTEAGTAIENCVQQQMELLSSFSYSRFADKFKMTFNKHIGKVSKYQNNLCMSGYPTDIPLYFCIEERVLNNDLTSPLFSCKMIRHDGAIVHESPKTIPLTDDIVKTLEANCGKIKGVFVVSYDMKDFYEQRIIDMFYLDMTSKEALYDSINKQRKQIYKSFFYDIPHGKVTLKIEG